MNSIFTFYIKIQLVHTSHSQVIVRIDSSIYKPLRTQTYSCKKLKSSNSKARLFRPGSSRFEIA